MHQRIRVATTRDGVRVAFAAHGSGPPLVKVAHWMTHLEYDWASPVWRHWLTELGRRHTVVRYDARDTGLSDREVEEVSLDAWVADLEAVVDAAGLGRFPLLGMCQAGPVALAYAARHPQRVTSLVLYGTYATGRFRRSAAERASAEALMTLMRSYWANNNPAIRQLWAARFVPGGGPEQWAWFTDLQRWSATADAAVRHMSVRYDLDLTETTRHVTAPALVVHPREDGVVPFDQGRQLAALLPDAQFLPLDSRNHLLLPDEPAWLQFLAALEEFLRSPPAGEDAAPGLDLLSTRETEVLGLVADGLSNTQIAARLYLSPRTVERHLSHVYDKLGVTGRAGRAAAAARIARAPTGPVRPEHGQPAVRPEPPQRAP